MRLLDCTLRDGANVVGKGFSGELTKMILEGLIKNNITLIECGNALGVGAYEANASIAPLTDEEYLKLIKPYASKAELGMFIGRKNATEKNIELTSSYGLSFLRIGADAGDGAYAVEGIKRVVSSGITARYSLMKAYILSPRELAEEAKMLESYGLKEITIMDSAGYMTPEQVQEYVSQMVSAVNIPVGFHGHSNLGLSSANAIMALKSGASVLDCGLMGMARSAGNLSTEAAIALLERYGIKTDIDFLGILFFIDKELSPAMEVYNYKSSLSATDIVLGYSGCHSSFLKLFSKAADKNNVNLYKLIMAVSFIDKKSPTEDLINETAKSLLK